MFIRCSIFIILILAVAGSMWTVTISAQSPRPKELYRWESDWFTRWGTTEDELRLLRGNDRDTQLRKLGVAKRFREMVAAGRAGDQVARTIISAELNRRCNGGRQVSRADCAAWANWMMYHTDPVEPYSETIDRLRPANLRAGGDKNRFLEIGRLLELGIGGPVDYKASRGVFYSWAAALGTKEISAQAKFNLGVMAEKGLGSPANREAAYRYYEEAERDGHPTAAFVMGTEILRLDPTAFDSASYSFWQAGDGGIAEGSYRYAMLLFEGKASVRMSKKRKSPTAAETCFAYFQKAALDGHVRAMAMLGTVYRKGIGVTEDSQKALEWWKRAARAGDAEAAWLTAAFYARQDEFSSGLPWLKRAAAGGYPGAGSLLRQWESKGIREKGLLSGFLSVMRFVGDVAAAYEQQRQAQIDYDNAIWLSTYNALNSGSANSGGTSSASASTGSGAGSLDDSGGASSAAELDAVSGSSSGTGVGGNGGNDSSSDSSSGADGDSTDSNSGTSDKSSGGSGKGGALIVSDSDHKKWKLAQAKQELAYVKQREKEAADLIRARASGEAETARIKAEAKRRSDARLIACHGSLEAAARAKVSCQ